MHACTHICMRERDRQTEEEREKEAGSTVQNVAMLKLSTIIISSHTKSTAFQGREHGFDCWIIWNQNDDYMTTSCDSWCVSLTLIVKLLTGLKL